MSGFGRKGASPGAPKTGGGFGSGQMHNCAATPSPISSDSDLAAKLEAFLAAERARSARSAPMEYAEQAASSYRSEKPRPERSMVLAYLLWLILGQVSAHRFYLGATQSALIQVGMFFTGLVLILMGTPTLYLGAIVLIPWVLWLLVDVFLIPGVHRKYAAVPQDTAGVFA